MFLITKPQQKQISRFLDNSRTSDFSYTEIGATKTGAPFGYVVDHNRIKLGSGFSDYDRAKAAIRQWKMFDFEWIDIFYADTPIVAGQAVAILVQHFGFYSLNAARIVYTMTESAEINRFGFAYGTLDEHAEIGEERFSVEFHPETGEVWYDLYAFSKPGSTLAKIAYPLGRQLQRAFAKNSMLAMSNFMSL